MKAYIRSVLDTSLLFSGECLYYLETDDQIIGSRYSSSRKSAILELIKDNIEQLKNLNINKVFSGDDLVYNADPISVDDPGQKVYQVSEHILKSIKYTLEIVSNVNDSRSLKTCLDRDIMTNILRLDKILSNLEITGRERIELSKLK